MFSANTLYFLPAVFCLLGAWNVLLLEECPTYIHVYQKLVVTQLRKYNFHIQIEFNYMCINYFLGLQKLVKTWGRDN